MKIKKHLVIGYYPETGQRWADSYEVASPDAAEFRAGQDYPDVEIAGVVAINDDGEMEVVA